MMTPLAGAPTPPPISPAMTELAQRCIDASPFLSWLNANTWVLLVVLGLEFLLHIAVVMVVMMAVGRGVGALADRIATGLGYQGR